MTRPPASAAATMIAVGAVLLVPVFSIAGGRLPGSLALVTVAALLVAAGIAREDTSRSGFPRWATGAALLAGLVVAAVQAFAQVPGLGTALDRLGAYRPLVAIAVVVCAGSAWRSAPAWFRALRSPALLVVGAATLAIAIHANPEPGIDVWVLRTQGARALAAGDNPYSVLYPNIYGPDTPILAKDVLTPDGMWIDAYPYLPLTLILDSAALLAGDVRWVQVAAIVVSAVALLLLGRGRSNSVLAAALLLLSPVSFLVTELAWTEPVLLAFMLLTAVVIRSADERGGGSLERGGGSRERWRWVLSAASGAAALSSKQYAVLLLVPLVAVVPRGLRWKLAAAASALAALVILPFVAWNPAGFVHGVVEFQLVQPFRPDAISWLAAIAGAGGPVLPTWPAFLVAGGVLVLGSRPEMRVARALAVGSLAWMVFVVLNKQAGINYYWLAGGMLLGAVAATEGAVRRVAQP